MKLLLTLTIAIIFFSCRESSSTTKSNNPIDNSSIAEIIADHSTKPEIIELRESMITFRNSLSSELITKGSTSLNNERFYLWHNTPANDRGKRDGISYGDLDSNQLEKFKSLMKLFLSTDGYQKVNDITVLSEGWLSEIKSKIWNPSFYSIDMFGDPNKHGSWGFQLDGHHCVLNFLVHGDNVSIVPAFLGGEPAKETFNGQSFDIFKDERDFALTLYNGMSNTEKKDAVTTSSTRSLQVGAAERPGKTDPYIGDYDYSSFKKGLKYSDMSTGTKEKLIILMKEYVYNLDPSFADLWWSDINKNIDDTYFVWIDNVDSPTSTSQFYYRIYNPYLWAEFNTEDVTGANQNNMADWNHIHTITRIPNNPNNENGGDYGIFAEAINQNGPKTLYEHYVLADHHEGSEVMFDYNVQMPHSHDNNHTHFHSH